MVEYFANLGADREGESFDEQHRSQTENFLQQQDWKEEEKHEINEPISEQEVANAIKLLDKHKATGPDKVHNRFLIEGGSAIVNAITLLFNESWRRGELPKGWKRAEITLIPKHAAASQVEKLRPISLLSVVGKLMDKIVAARVTTRGEKEEWFLPWQGGFRSGRGVCDQLVAFTHRVAEAWSKRRVCVTAFLDASKAYDRVHRPSVLAKLIRLGLKGRALRWIADFLSDRFACVRYDDVRSRYREFRYGLPQGSCLSPILFNVFLRDVFTPDDLDADRDGGVYADDIRVSAFGDDVHEAAKKLSAMLLKIGTWGKKNRVRFDTDSDKCGFVVFSRRVQPDPEVRFNGGLLRRKHVHKCLGVHLDGALRFSHHIDQVKAKTWRAYHSMRRIVGNDWGASLSAVKKLYEGLVRPVLEYACIVWDGAAKSEKTKLERVHRLSLLAATGAHKRTSTAALEVYSSVESCQDRRDYLTATYLNRVIRLDPHAHPVAALYRVWLASGSPVLCPSVSFFPRAAALCRRLSRFSEFSDGGVPHAEPIPPVPPAKRSGTPRARKIDKTLAKRAHRKLLRRLRPETDGIIYTDGSATPNPGKIGLGISLQFGDSAKTFGEPIGVGSILTAELCAIQFALEKLQLLITKYNRVFVFSDCQSAIDLINQRTSPTGNFDLVATIQTYISDIRAAVQLHILWVPAHVGVLGNERANDAAKAAAYNVQHPYPSDGQPPVPLGTSNAFVKHALKERRQQRWLRVLADKVGCQHLARLKPEIGYSPAFFVGAKPDQRILARLRFGQSCLNYSTSRYIQGADEVCECGTDVETAEHFLLHCPLYQQPRVRMIQSVELSSKLSATEEVLLGASSVRLDEKQWSEVVAAVAKYVRATGRSL